MSDFAFLSDHRFLRAGATAANAAFAVAGIAWDGATTHRPGARLAPRAIRQASLMLCDGMHPFFDVSPAGELADLGDLLLPNTSLAAMRSALAPLLPPLLARHHMLWLGGDHSITLSLLQAYRQHLGRALAVLHLDAHCDTWSDHFGEPSGHGTWVREALEQGLVMPEGMVQIGIRSSGLREARDFVRDRGGLIFSARDLRGLHGPTQLQPVLDTIGERLRSLGWPPLYLSLDIDCLDPAFAPGTGTPEPGGLDTNQVLTLLEGSAAWPFVGADFVEVSPPFDHAELTSHAAAVLAWTYLCGQSARLGAARKQPHSR